MDIDIYLSILFHLSISFDSEKQRMIQRDRKNNQISKILLSNIYIYMYTIKDKKYCKYFYYNYIFVTNFQEKNIFSSIFNKIKLKIKYHK